MFEYIFWWKVEKKAIEIEALNYESIKFWHSSRGASISCILFSIAVTTGFMIFGKGDLIKDLDISSYLITLIIAIGLIIFMHRGHRWVFITAMIWWTFEKGAQLANTFNTIAMHIGHVNNTTVIMSIVWWSIYMHFFYKALRVEIIRKKVIN